MWPTRSLREVLRGAFLGVPLNRRRPEQKAHEVPVVTAKDLEEGALTGPFGTASLDPATSYLRYQIEPGDVLLTAYSLNPRVVLAADTRGALATSSLIVLRPDAALRGAVLAAYLRGARGQVELESKVRPAATCLSVEDVVAMVVPVPDAATQHQIEAWYLAAEAAFLAGLAEARLRRELGAAAVDRLLFPETKPSARGSLPVARLREGRRRAYEQMDALAVPETYQEYRALLLRLHEVGESAEADELRDAMDDLWWQLGDEDRERARELSAGLLAQSKRRRTS